MAAAAAPRFPADVAGALANYPATALVAAELDAALAEGGRVTLEVVPWLGVPATAAEAAAAAKAALQPLLCVHVNLETQNKDPYGVMRTHNTPAKLFLPLAFETAGAGLAAAPVAALDIGAATAAGLTLNSQWAHYKHTSGPAHMQQPSLLLVDVVTGLVEPSFVPSLAKWPELAGPPGRRLLTLKDELRAVLSARPAGAGGAGGGDVPDPPPPFVPTSPESEEQLRSLQRQFADAAMREANDFAHLETTAARKATRVLLQAVLDGDVAVFSLMNCRSLDNIIASMGPDGKSGGFTATPGSVEIVLLLETIKAFINMPAPSFRDVRPVVPRFPRNGDDSAELGQFAQRIRLAVADRRFAAAAPLPLALSVDEIAHETSALDALLAAESEERRLGKGVEEFLRHHSVEDFDHLIQTWRMHQYTYDALMKQMQQNLHGGYHQSMQQQQQQQVAQQASLSKLDTIRPEAARWSCAFLRLCFGARFAALHARDLEVSTTHVGQRVELQQLQQLQLLRARPAAEPAAFGPAAGAQSRQAQGRAHQHAVRRSHG